MVWFLRRRLRVGSDVIVCNYMELCGQVRLEASERRKQFMLRNLDVDVFRREYEGVWNALDY